MIRKQNCYDIHSPLYHVVIKNIAIVMCIVLMCMNWQSLYLWLVIVILICVYLLRLCKLTINHITYCYRCSSRHCKYAVECCSVVLYRYVNKRGPPPRHLIMHSCYSWRRSIVVRTLVSADCKKNIGTGPPLLNLSWK